jgi:hypothetical protein
MEKRASVFKYIVIPLSFVAGTIIGYAIAYLSGFQPSFVPLAAAGIGLLVALSLPILQTFFLQAPKLSLEINAIKRTVSESALVSIEDDAELSHIKPHPYSSPSFPIFMSGGELPKRSVRNGHSLAELDELLIKAKQRLRDLPKQIDERKKELDRTSSFLPTTFSKYDCDRLNQPLAPEIEFDAADPGKTLQTIRSAYQDRIEAVEKTYSDLQSGIPAAERKLESIRADLLENRSYFTVSASLINSGRFNTAIKVPALLRVAIGEGNYIDLKLTLKDFEEKSEISANGTRIVTFESAEVSTLPEEDRKLINTYWGQSVSSRLYSEDIHSTIYTSNAIAFAEGLYQKIIYDRLARAASS